MEFISSVLIGCLIGCLAWAVLRSRGAGVWPTVSVSLMGALLGLATHTGLGSDGLIDFAACEYVASGVGSVLALMLWFVAQRLFLATPTGAAHD